MALKISAKHSPVSRLLALRLVPTHVAWPKRPANTTKMKMLLNDFIFRPYDMLFIVNDNDTTRNDGINLRETLSKCSLFCERGETSI
jgi:hypothetical protein